MAKTAEEKRMQRALLHFNKKRKQNPCRKGFEESREDFMSLVMRLPEILEKAKAEYQASVRGAYDTVEILEQKSEMSGET